MLLRLLHISDVHLDASFSAFGDLAESRGLAVLQAFCELPGLAKHHQVHAVLIGGDLFDSPQPRMSTLADARQAIRRTVDDGCPVFVVPGNHDSVTAHPNAYRDALGGAVVFKDAVFGEPVSMSTAAGRLHVYGFAFDVAESRDPISSFKRVEAGGFHVVLMHAAVQVSPHWEGSPNTPRVTRQLLGELDVEYIALGDYHTFRPPEHFDTERRIPACYPGSFAAVDLTEDGQRGYAVVEIDEGEPPQVSHHSSGLPPVMAQAECNVTDMESEVQVAESIAGQTEGNTIPVVELVGSPSFPLDADVVHAELCARFGHAKVVDRSLHYSSARLDELAERDTVVGHIVRLARNQIESTDDESARQIVDRALRVALRELRVE